MPLVHPKNIFLYSQLLTLATAVANSRLVRGFGSSPCQVHFQHKRGLSPPGKQACDHAAMGQREAWGEGAGQECLLLVFQCTLSAQLLLCVVSSCTSTKRAEKKAKPSCDAILTLL